MLLEPEMVEDGRLGHRQPHILAPGVARIVVALLFLAVQRAHVPQLHVSEDLPSGATKWGVGVVQVAELLGVQSELVYEARADLELTRVPPDDRSAIPDMASDVVRLVHRFEVHRNASCGNWIDLAARGFRVVANGARAHVEELAPQHSARAAEHMRGDAHGLEHAKAYHSEAEEQPDETPPRLQAVPSDNDAHRSQETEARQAKKAISQAPRLTRCPI
mmetsp:Transcript_73396/g.203802  ORF Transcript_73396/g.203802 Transcript_73396/m.203802 type:complete len:219 (+) Transcript_73396:162-818(+)